MSKPKEFTLRIYVPDMDKFSPMFKDLMLKPKITEEKYGFSANASALGDQFAECAVYERALEKIKQDDLSKEDFFTKEALKEDDSDEEWDPYYEDVQDLIEDAFKQAEHYRDRRNNEYGTQRPLPLSFQKGDTNGQQNLPTGN